MRVEFVRPGGAARHDTVSQISVPRVGEGVYINWAYFEVERVIWVYETGSEAMHPRAVVILREPAVQRRWWQRR